MLLNVKNPGFFSTHWRMFCWCCQRWWAGTGWCVDSWWFCRCRSCPTTQQTDPDEWSGGSYRRPGPCCRCEGLCPPSCSLWTFASPGRKTKMPSMSVSVFIVILIFCCFIREASLYADAAAYLLRVHWGGANGVNDSHVWPSVGVHQVTAVALPQGVHHARLIQILQRGQVLHSVEHRRVRLVLKVRGSHVLTQCHL